MYDDLPEPSGEFLLYTGQDGKVKVECRFQDETLWLTQRLMAELFGVGVTAINKHLKNIFDSGELEQEATISKMEIVRSSRTPVEFPPKRPASRPRRNTRPSANIRHQNWLYSHFSIPGPAGNSPWRGARRMLA